MRTGKFIASQKPFHLRVINQPGTVEFNKKLMSALKFD